MSAETALRAVLAADSAVVALVAARISADRAEQDEARPFVVFSRTASQITTALNGAHLRTQAALDVQCWANTRLDADALADAVADAVRGVTSQRVEGRSGAFDPDQDAFVTTLNVLWWE